MFNVKCYYYLCRHTALEGNSFDPIHFASFYLKRGWQLKFIPMIKLSTSQVPSIFYTNFKMPTGTHLLVEQRPISHCGVGLVIVSSGRITIIDLEVFTSSYFQWQWANCKEGMDQSYTTQGILGIYVTDVCNKKGVCSSEKEYIQLIEKFQDIK